MNLFETFVVSVGSWERISWNTERLVRRIRRTLKKWISSQRLEVKYSSRFILEVYVQIDAAGVEQQAECNVPEYSPET